MLLTMWVPPAVALLISLTALDCFCDGAFTSSSYPLIKWASSSSSSFPSSTNTATYQRRVVAKFNDRRKRLLSTTTETSAGPWTTSDLGETNETVTVTATSENGAQQQQQQQQQTASSSSVGGTTASSSSAAAGAAVADPPTNDEQKPQPPQIQAETEELLKVQRQQLESKYTTDLARLKLTVGELRETLEELTIKSREQVKERDLLQEELDLEVQDKRVRLEELELEWKAKYEAKVNSLSQEIDTTQQKADEELVEMQRTIMLYRDKLSDAETTQLEMKVESAELERRIQDEIESRQIAIVELEKELKERFEFEKGLMIDEAQTTASALEQSRLEAEQKLREAQATNLQEKILMEKELQSVRDEVGIRTRQLKNAKKFHGTLRRQINKLRQSMLFRERKNRQRAELELEEAKSNFTETLRLINESIDMERMQNLENERDEALIELASAKRFGETLEKELNTVRTDLTNQLLDVQIQAAKQFEDLRVQWTKRFATAMMKQKEIIEERNEAVAVRDEKIEEYEEELGSVRKMTLRSTKLILKRVGNVVLFWRRKENKKDKQ